jgi:tousled-like kinase
LSSYIKKFGPIPEKDAKIMLKMILNGIKYLHEHKLKIIHYDLKPSNLIFHQGMLKIADFGLCKTMENEEMTKIELTNQGAG